MDASISQGNLLSVMLALLAVILIGMIWFLARRNRTSRNLRLPPGPPGWPVIGNALEVLLQHPGSSNDDFYFSRYSRQYGDIYKLELGSQLMYVLSNVDHVREVFGHSKVQGRPRAVAFEKAFGPTAKGVFFASGPEWAVIKIFVKHLFRDLDVGKGIFADDIQLEIRRFVKKVDSLTEEPVWNIVELFETAIANIMCGITFGKQYDYDDPEFEDLIYIKNSLVRALGPSGIALTNKFLCGLPFGPGRKLIDCLTQFKTFMKTRIRESKSRPMKAVEFPNNFVKAFLEKIEKGETYFDEENLIACCLDLFAAGTETPSATLAWAILFLTVHPSVHDKCQQELDNFVEVYGVMPSFSDRSKLPYMQATILETERLATAATLGAAHVVEADLRLLGYDFPKGTLVVSNYSNMNMDGERFLEPGIFRPERFIDNAGHFKNDTDIIPFSVGRRTCLGEPLARMEVFLFLVSLLRTFTFTAPEDVQMPDVRKGVYGVNRLPLPFAVVIKRREVN